MEIIIRREAKELRINKYFTGKPCKYGHISKRYTGDGRCIECVLPEANRRTKNHLKNMTEEERKSHNKIQYERAKYKRRNMPMEEKKVLLRKQRESRRKWWGNLTKEGKEEEKIRIRMANRKLRENKSSEELWLRDAFYDARRRAKKKTLEFSIKKENLIVPEYCPALGIKLEYNRKNNKINFNNTSPSVDRIDNNKGYTKDNIAIISWRANSIKGNATLEELKMLVKWLEEQQN